MLANFFGKSKPVNFILILVLFLSYYVLDFVVNTSSKIHVDNLLNIALIIPAFLVLFFLYNFVLTKNKLTWDNSYAFLLFVIGIGCLQEAITDYQIVGKYILLFLFFRRVYSLRTSKSTYEKLFDSGMWIGVLFLLSPFYLLYIVLLYLAIFLFVKIDIRSLLIPVLGFAIPIFLFFTYHFYMDSVAVFYQLFEVTLIFDINFYTSNSYLILLTIFGFFTLVSILMKSRKIFSVSNKFKRSWALLLMHLILALTYMSIVDVKDGTEFVAFLIPSSLIIANWLQTMEKKLITNVVLVVFLVLSFAIHFIA